MLMPYIPIEYRISFMRCRVTVGATWSAFVCHVPSTRSPAEMTSCHTILTNNQRGRGNTHELQREEPGNLRDATERPPDMLPRVRDKEK